MTTQPVLKRIKLRLLFSILLAVSVALKGSLGKPDKALSFACFRFHTASKLFETAPDFYQAFTCTISCNWARRARMLAMNS